jgi:hypothetical protein
MIIIEQTSEVELISINKNANFIGNEKHDVMPKGFITAEEWRIRCKKNISDIFKKYEQGNL